MAPLGPRVLDFARPAPTRAATARQFGGQEALAMLLKVLIAADQTASAHQLGGQEVLAILLKVRIAADPTASAHQLGGQEVLAILLKGQIAADPTASAHRSRDHGPRERTEDRFRRTLATGAMRPPQQGDARPAAAMAAHAGMTDPDE